MMGQRRVSKRALHETKTLLKRYFSKKAKQSIDDKPENALGLLNYYAEVKADEEAIKLRDKIDKIIKDSTEH